MIPGRFRRRDRLVTLLAGQLADSRAREAALAERVAWYQAAMDGRPALRAVRGGRQGELAAVVPIVS